MKITSFGELLWSSVASTWGPIITIVGIALSFIGYFVAPETETIPLRWFLVIICICLLLLAIFIRAAWEANKNQKIQSPRVIYVKDPPKAFSDAFALFLVEPTPLLSYDAIVSIYYLEEGMEKLVGVGKVINVQNDQKVQVLVLRDYDFGDKAKAIKNNSKNELEKLIVKSSIPSFMMEVNQNG